MAEIFHTFNLALALAVEAATDDLHLLARRAATDARPDFREVLAPVVQALAEVTAGRPRAAAALLSDLGEKAERIGGVRVEREIIQDTLARALIDAGEPTRTAELLHHPTAPPPATTTPTRTSSSQPALRRTWLPAIDPHHRMTYSSPELPSAGHRARRSPGWPGARAERKA